MLYKENSVSSNTILPGTPKNEIIKSFEYLKKEEIANSWNIEQENILQIWAEKSSGWAWLHDKSARYYNCQDNLFTFTSIVVNTVAGGIGFLGNMNINLHYLIAVLNILIAMGSSFQKFMRTSEKYEAHSHYSKIFSSYTRKITLELTLHPGDRKECIDFCKQCRDEYDKAVTDCPLVPDNIIKLFRTQFKDEKNKPEIANGLFHFNNYPNTSFLNKVLTIIQNLQNLQNNNII